MSDGSSEAWKDTQRAGRQRRLDNAVRQVFGLYESERAYGMTLLHRRHNLLQMRIRRQTMYDMDHRFFEKVLHQILRAYHAG